MRSHFTPKLPNTTCQQCQQEFYALPTDLVRGKGRYCSRPCYYAAKVANSTQETRTCQHCGTEFRIYQSEIRKGYGQYCSRACHAAAQVGVERPERQNRVHGTCEICGAPTVVKRSAAENGDGRYCSKACLGIANGQRGRARAKPENTVTCTCERCGKEFQIAKARTKYGEGHFCSWACKTATPDRRVDTDGYVSRRIGDAQWQHEHRYVMEQILGRPLRSGEVVHHIDEDKTNNDPSNLRVLTNEEHARIHGVMRREKRWATDHDYCSQCGSVAHPHKGHGLCRLCFQRERRQISPDHFRK